jgi:hypothetical protein
MQSYYSFSASYNSSAYSELSSPTVLTESGGDDFQLTNGGTGPTGPGYSIGFNFYFNGEEFTRFGVNSNGFIGLGTETDGINVSSTLSTPISYSSTISPSRLRNRIVAFGQDIVHLGSGYTPAISYSTLGSNPNRILVVQFKGWRRYGNDGVNDIINFQIRLHETSNKIEIIYGPSSATSSSSYVEVGLGGKSTGEFFNLTTSDWGSPTYGQTVDAKMTFSQAARPANGTIYTWTLQTMAYSSSTTEQATTNFVLKGQTNQQIVRLKISTSGWVLPFSVTSITFTTTGTTTVGNLTAARVYYTNTDAFATTTQFGSAINNPSGSLVFNGSQALGENGVHSFWLVYDISGSATTTDQYVDGTCESFTTNESGNPTRNPSVTDPAGNRQILGGLSGTVTVGNGGDYPTLTGTTISTGLFKAINDLGLSGNLTANIISDITETGFTALKQWNESGGSGYTFTIQPADACLKTISGSGPTALIPFNGENGADRVTINGNYNGSGEYLKFSNTHSSPISAIYFGNGASNNNIKNCIIESGGSYGVIYFSSGATVNETNLIENCQIKNYSGYPTRGIYFYVANNSTTYHNNNTIRNCKIFNFSNTGALIAGGNNNTIEGCEIYSNGGGGYAGINFTTPTAYSTESFIRNNKIYDLNSTSSNVTGIYCYAYGGTLTVFNNTISFETSTTGQVYGIYLMSDASYTATLNLYYNSIYVRGTVGNTGNYSAGIYKYSSFNTLRIKNNSIFNSRTTTTGTLKNYGIYFLNTTATTSDYNYNAYFVNGINSYIGYWSSDKSSLADWQSASGKDANSISSNPLYVSESNLKPFNTSPLINAGTSISGITTDIDGIDRHASTPYIGAYESSQTPVTVDFCNLETGNTIIKEGQTSTFYARVEKSGVTNSEGQGAGIQCWIGYNDSNTDPSTWSNWTEATYSGDAGNRDEYTVTFPSTLTSGTYHIASRFFITNAIDYQYGGFGGEWNNNSSTLTIQDNTINFANAVNSPVSVKLGVNKKFYAKYGLPDITTGGSECPAVQAWIGYNTSSTDPSGWGNWVAATYVGKSGNYHEYEANFGSTFNVGTYYYASRFKLNDDSYVYGGYSSEGGGIYNGTSNTNGTINVTAELPLFESFDNVTAHAFPKARTVHNYNGSGSNWVNQTTNYKSSPNALRCQNPFNYTNADAWVFSPALNLDGGKTYKITFYYSASGTTSYARLRGQYGTAPAKASMITGDLFNYQGFGSMQRGSGTFTPSTSGTYYIGWVNFSNYEGNFVYVYIDNIEIYEAPENTSTQTITANNTTQYTFGSTGITIKFEAGNSQNLTINVDQINSSPGVNGSLPSGVNQTISKYWNIALTSGSVTTGVYSISIDVTGISGINSPKDIYLLKRTNSNSEWQNLGKPSFTEGNLCTWTGQTSFSEFTLGGDSENPLPVELNSFTAKVERNSVSLTWQTSTEVDNYGFEIEKSENSNVKSKTWQTVGFIQGQGNSNSPHSYSFTDEKLNFGKYSYRLKIINTDGFFEYSSEIEAEIGLPNEYYLSQNYPNPFNPTTKIEYQLPVNSEVKIELYSITGERAATLVNHQQEAGYYTIEVNASKLRLASGVYVYRMVAANNSNAKTYINTRKLVVLK